MSFIIQKIYQWFVSLSVKKNLTIVWGGPWPPVAPPGSATDRTTLLPISYHTQPSLKPTAIVQICLYSVIIFIICSCEQTVNTNDPIKSIPGVKHWRRPTTARVVLVRCIRRRKCRNTLFLLTLVWDDCAFLNVALSGEYTVHREGI